MISEILACFRELETKTNQLVQSIKESELPFWVPHNEDPALTGMAGMSRVISGYWYEDGQEGRETINCYGLICINESQLNIINQVNTLKNRFKGLSKSLEKQNKSAWLEVKGQLKSTLRDSSLSRIHLKQTWRNIPVLEEAPHKVMFNWYSSGRSIKKLTVKEAIDKLLNIGADHDYIQVQLDLLNKLSESTKLAQVQNQAPLMRANIVYRSKEDGKVTSRKATNAAIPIFVLGSELPKHNIPSIAPPTERTRAKRSDQTLSDEPYLPSIRAHLYV